MRVKSKQAGEKTREGLFLARGFMIRKKKRWRKKLGCVEAEDVRREEIRMKKNKVFYQKYNEELKEEEISKESFTILKKFAT